jgi:hypothetical protein
MTKARFLAEVDSYELSQWLEYFRVKGEREKDARESAEFQARLDRGL